MTFLDRISQRAFAAFGAAVLTGGLLYSSFASPGTLAALAGAVA